MYMTARSAREEEEGKYAAQQQAHQDGQSYIVLPAIQHMYMTARSAREEEEGEYAAQQQAHQDGQGYVVLPGIQYMQMETLYFLE